MAQHYTTKFGPQPIRDAVWQAGYTHAEFRDLTGITPSSHVWLAMAGRCPPNPELRRIAPRVLGVPLERLFTPEALAAVHHPKRRHGSPKAVAP